MMLAYRVTDTTMKKHCLEEWQIDRDRLNDGCCPGRNEDSTGNAQRTQWFVQGPDAVQ